MTIKRNSQVHAHTQSEQPTAWRGFALTVALGILVAACAGVDEASLEAELDADDVTASQQTLSKQAFASTANADTLAGVSRPPVVKPPRDIVVYFKCGWDPKSLSAQCTCQGDADCNRMFSSGFCGANASCDNGAGTCTCDLKL